jgi:hypothetical protein
VIYWITVFPDAGTLTFEDIINLEGWTPCSWFEKPPSLLYGFSDNHVITIISGGDLKRWQTPVDEIGIQALPFAANFECFTSEN